MAKVCTVDADRARELVRDHGVSALPTTVLYLGGKELTRFVGSRSEGFVLNIVREHTYLPVGVLPGWHEYETGESEDIP
jgi:thioredoxin-like negative regulator of GroEL